MYHFDDNERQAQVSNIILIMDFNGFKTTFDSDFKIREERRELARFFGQLGRRKHFFLG